MKIDTSIEAYTRAWNEQRHDECIRIVNALGIRYRPVWYPPDPLQLDYDEERQDGWAFTSRQSGA